MTLSNTFNCGSFPKPGFILFNIPIINTSSPTISAINISPNINLCQLDFNSPFSLGDWFLLDHLSICSKNDFNKIVETKKLTVNNEKKITINYTVQTSSFKKISKSKMHIILLKNKIKILRSFEHQIKKNGRYFISYINVDNHEIAKNLCNEIKLNKLDCLIKTS